MSKEILQQKEQIVSEYAEKLSKAQSFVLVDYRGLNVTEDTAMRTALRSAGVEYKVVKNRSILRSLQSVGVEGFDSFLEGPTAIAISYTDAVAPARVIVESVKKYNDKISVKAGYVEGKFFDQAGIKTIATIPPKETLIAQLLGLLLSPVRGLAVACSEIAKKQEAN